jgi:hypothetical protein
MGHVFVKVLNHEANRAEFGEHLLFNAFWAVAHRCVHQLLMKDPMHQIDLGVIIRLIMAILRKILGRCPAVHQ